MSTIVKQLRESASFLATYAIAAGAIAVDTTNNRIRVGDGSTLGGWQTAKYTDLGLTLLNVLTASTSASVGDSSSLSSSYDDYLFTFDNFIPVTNANGLNLTLNGAGTNYLNNTGASGAYIDLIGATNTLSNSTSWGLCGSLRLSNINGATSGDVRAVMNTAFLNTGAALVPGNPAAGYIGAKPITSWSLQCASGNIAAGVVKIYGFRKS